MNELKKGEGLWSRERWMRSVLPAAYAAGFLLVKLPEKREVGDFACGSQGGLSAAASAPATLQC